MGEIFNPTPEKLQKIFDLRKRLNTIKDKAEFRQMWDEIGRFGKKLLAKYPDARQYQMFHVFSGSTLEGHKTADFPGEDSVEKFLEELVKKYGV